MTKNEMQEILVKADIDFTEAMTKDELQELIDSIKTKVVKEGKRVFLKQIKAHVKGYRLGRHLVMGGAPQEFYLNEAEEKELNTAGPQHWIKEVSEKEVNAAPMSNRENAERMQTIKSLKTKGISFKAEMTNEELKELNK